MGNKDIPLSPFPCGYHCSRWFDGGVHLPGLVEMVDKRPVLIANPESVIPKNQGLRIQRHPRSSGTGAPEAVTGEFGSWEIRETGEREGGGRIEAGKRVAGWVGEEDGVEVVELEVGRGGSSGEGGGEADLEFVDAGLVGGCALGVPIYGRGGVSMIVPGFLSVNGSRVCAVVVLLLHNHPLPLPLLPLPTSRNENPPTTIRKHPQDALVARTVLRPRRTLDSDAGPERHSVSELVPKVARNNPVPSELLVGENIARAGRLTRGRSGHTLRGWQRIGRERK